MITEPRTPPLWALIFICSFAAFCALLPADAIPAIAAFFRVSADQAESIITGYLFGYGLGPLLYAPLSNRFGRKKALLLGLGVALIGMALSLLALSSHGLGLMVAGRFIAGIGASAGLTLGMVILKDTASEQQARKIYSYIVVAFAFAPAMALAVGGMLTEYVGIVSIFILMPVLVLLLAAVTWSIDESYRGQPIPLRVGSISSSYLLVLKQPLVMLLVLILSMASAATYVFNGLSPIIAIGQLHLSSSLYGNLAIIPSFGFLLGGFISSTLSSRYDVRTATRLGIVLLVCGSVMMVLAFLADWISLVSMLLPAMVMFTGVAIVIPNTSMSALSVAKDSAAAASVLVALVALASTTGNATGLRLPIF